MEGDLLKSILSLSVVFYWAFFIVQVSLVLIAVPSNAQECLSLFALHHGNNSSSSSILVTTRLSPFSFQRKRLPKQGSRLGSLFGEDVTAMVASHLLKRIQDSNTTNALDEGDLERIFLARKDTPNTLVLRTEKSILVMPHVFLLMDQVRNYKLRDGDFVGTMMVKKANVDTEPLSKLNPHFEKIDNNLAKDGFRIYRHGSILPTQLLGVLSVNSVETSGNSVELLDQIGTFVKATPNGLRDSLELLTPVCIVNRRIPGIAVPVRIISPLREFGAFSAATPSSESEQNNLGWRFRAVFPNSLPTEARNGWAPIFEEFQDFRLHPSDEVEFTVLEVLPELAVK